MLSNITWTQFLVVLGIGTIIYYLFYFIKFYARDFFEKLNQRSTAYEAHLDDNLQVQSTEPDELSQLEELVNTIKKEILVKAGNTATKEQLFEAFAERVANYDGLHQPAYRYALNNFIIQHSKILCGVEIEEDELEVLWKNLPR